MRVFATMHENAVRLRARAESGSTIGDLTIDVEPGGEAFGRTHAQLKAIANGEGVFDHRAHDRR